MQLDEAGEQGEAASRVSTVHVRGLNLFLAVPPSGVQVIYRRLAVDNVGQQ